jgi:hypothetical protein
MFAQIGSHRLLRFGQERRGGLVIEVDARHPGTKCGARRCGASAKEWATTEKGQSGFNVFFCTLMCFWGAWRDRDFAVEMGGMKDLRRKCRIMGRARAAGAARFMWWLRAIIRCSRTQTGRLGNLRYMGGVARCTYFCGAAGNAFEEVIVGYCRYLR